MRLTEREGGAGVPAFLRPMPPGCSAGNAQEFPTEENGSQ